VTQTAQLSRLEAALGHTFACPELLVHALTHRSLAYEQAAQSADSAGKSDASSGSSEVERPDNERLEFLGDAVLGLVVAEALYRSNPDWKEGELTRLRAQLVSRRHMAEVAQAIGLGDYLRLGKGEERSGGRKKAAILANAMEAVIAAMFLDGRQIGSLPGGSLPDGSIQDGPPQNDGLETISAFAGKHILGATAEKLAHELQAGAALGDHKSALQEYLQAGHSGVPQYLVKDESGPDHRKRFQVEVRLRSADGELGAALARGIGSTKKKAEQEAARRALANLTREAQTNAADGEVGDEPAFAHREAAKA
jgi:ribonuclease-3